MNAALHVWVGELQSGWLVLLRAFSDARQNS